MHALKPASDTILGNALVQNHQQVFVDT